MMGESLDHLNPAQAEAVTSTEGFVRVIAGAGSGKTRALASRFAYLVNDLGVLPGHILCVTFSNKSANEMRQRIHRYTGDQDTGYINTFHGFCSAVLLEESHAIQYPKNFLVLDNPDIDSMLQAIYDERGLTLRNMTFSHARDMIEMLKLYERPGYYVDLVAMPIEDLHRKYIEATEVKDIIFYGYLYQEKKCFGVDYNDLILLTLYIFSQHEDIRLKWQQRLEYIMIDEFQDIDEPQYRLMRVLCDYHKNLFVVGDPDQTIYSWRGAKISYLMDFDKVFPEVKTILMVDNYRSTPQIIAVANSLIEKNATRIKKELRAVSGDGPAVVCHEAENSAREGQWIARQVQRLHDADGVPYRKICVLYRAHYVTRTIEDAFLQAQIPYTIYSGTPFFMRAEIKDALSYLRLIIYKDDLSFARVVNTPRRNMGNRRMAFLKEYAEGRHCSLWQSLTECIDDPVFKGTGARKFIDVIQSYASTAGQMPVSELLAAVLNDSGYEQMLRTAGAQERLDNLAELKQSIYDYENSCGEECTVEHYLSHVALFSNADADTEASDKVKMMTVHAAKGLEFPCVFLCALNEGIFPSRKIRTMTAMEEERRLAFVAMTRAEKRLFLSNADGRNIDGSPRFPSRFILNVDQRLLEYTAPPQEALIDSARATIRASEKMLSENESEGRIDHFSPRQRVTHPLLGPGVILEVDEEKNAYLIQFDKVATPRNIAFKAALKAL